MKDLNEKQIEQAMNATMEDFVGKLKTTPIYEIYKEKVKRSGGGVNPRMGF